MMKANMNIGLKAVIITLTAYFQFCDYLHCEEYYTNIILSGSVNAQAGRPVSDEIVLGKIDVSYIKEMQGYDFFVHEILTSQGTTTGDGRFTISFDVQGMVVSFWGSDIMLENRTDWLMINKARKKIDDSQYEFTVTVIELSDSDKNGIHDPFEMQLAREFCPSLKLNVYGTYCYPEPVNIMTGPAGTDIYVTITDGGTEDKIHTEIKAHFVEYKRHGVNTRWEQIMTKEQFGARWNYSEHFKTNPIMLGTGDSLKIPLNQYDLSKGYELRRLGKVTNLWIHFNWKGGNKSAWWTTYRREMLSALNPSDVDHHGDYLHTIYCTIWEAKQSGYLFDNYVTAIQYWFFYPFDDFGNDHEGDWEHINVIAETQIPDHSKIERVQFYFHEKWREWKPDVLEIHNETHVRVYVGGTFMFDRPTNKDGHVSGASYPAPGEWRNIASVFNDFVHGKGYLIDWSSITNDGDQELDGRGIELLKDPNILGYEFFEPNIGGHPELSWLKANVFFGEPHYDPHRTLIFQGYDMDATLGPYNHQGWRTLGNIKGFEFYWNEWFFGGIF